MPSDILGFCRYCIRVRWLAVVEQTEPNIEGKCRQCAREEAEKDASGD